MTGLEPCPFCGATRGLYALDVDRSISGEPRVFCDSCKAVFECERAFTVEEAIEAWNTRAEKTCTLTYEGVDQRMQGEELYPVDTLLCTSCGGYVYDVNANNYCPNCGAKVVD